MTSSAAVSSLCRPMSARKSCRLSAAPTIAWACGWAGSGGSALAAAGSGGSSAGPRPSTALGPSSRGGSALLGGRAHLEAVGLELAREQLDLVVGQIVLEREGLELGRQDEAALLCSFEQDARGLGFQQFLKLGLSQFLLVGVRRRTASNLSHCRTIVLDWPGGPAPPIARRWKRGTCSCYSATAASLVC